MAELDAEGFAGEVTSLRPPARARTLLPRLGAAVRTGVRAGVVPAAAVFVIYFLANRATPLPWVRIATLLAIYGPGVGVSLALSTELLVMAFDRIARLGFGLVVIANPITACALAGGLAGILPGAIGVTVFGAYNGPFVGTVLIAGALIAGSVMVAIPAARRARQARFGATEDSRVLIAAAVIATLILCGVAAVIAPVIVASAFDQVRGEVTENGALVGAVAGAIGGAVVGVYVGMVVAIGRALRPPARRAQRGP